MRVRRSTVLLSLAFVATLVLYLQVRPAPQPRAVVPSAPQVPATEAPTRTTAPPKPEPATTSSTSPDGDTTTTASTEPGESTTTSTTLRSGTTSTTAAAPSSAPLRP